MISCGPKLLVTTALEETWGANEEILFLGDWCKRYERFEIWSRRKNSQLPFHWDDRTKLKRDYLSLQTLHRRLLSCLSKNLNEFHGIEHDVRYWQILLDPWLFTYIGVAFDRWECLRIAFEANQKLEMIRLQMSDENRTQFSYLEFHRSALSDYWNQGFYQRIIDSEYANQCIVYVKQNFDKKIGGFEYGADIRRRFGLSGKLKSISERVVRSIFPKQDIAFVGSKFGHMALLRLHVSLAQAPRLFLREFYSQLDPKYLTISSSPFRLRSLLGFEPTTKFETFISNWILRDLPSSFLEHFSLLRQNAQKVNCKAKVIVTAGEHWGNSAVKFWIAELVNQGSKLVVSEHGGSLPPLYECFEFENDVADVKATWFKPYHAKHKQLPASKIVGNRNFKIDSKQYCSIIANECPRWAYRVQFYPIAGQWQRSFNMVIKLYEYLDSSVKKYCKVKPYPSNQGWNTHKRFIDFLGKEHVFTEKKLSRVFRQSRIIVCTYPETTFAEAMASGIPTILVYPSELYELHEVALPLLKLLVSMKIAFTDATSAARHLNQIWKGPMEWWNSKDILLARKEFGAQALGMGGNWMQQWRTFLREVASEAY